MSNPPRRRPGAASPIQLLPQVEEVRTAHVEDSGAVLTAVPPLTTSAPAETIAAALEAEQPAAAPTAPESTAPEQALVPFPPAAAAATSPVATTSSTTPPRGSAAPAFADPDTKKATTLAIRRSIKARAETAVLRTAGFEGGYKSWASFVEGALERELQRLENEFNGGVPFPENTGSFRNGRPLGS